MADERITDYAAVSSVAGTALFETVVSGVNKKITAANLATSLATAQTFGTPGFTRYVDNTNGNDGNDGLSWTTALKTLGAALTALSGASKGDIFLAGGFQGNLSAQTVLLESISIHGNQRHAHGGFDAYDNGSWFEWTGSNPASAGLATGSIFKWNRNDRGGVFENVSVKVTGTMPNLRVFDMRDWQNMSIMRDVFVKGDNYAAAFCAFNTLSLGAPGYFKMERCWSASGAARPFWIGGGVENIELDQCGIDDGTGSDTARAAAGITVGATGVSGEVSPGGVALALKVTSFKNEMGTAADYPDLEVQSGFDATVVMDGCYQQKDGANCTTASILYSATPSRPDDNVGGIPVSVLGMSSQSRTILIDAPNAVGGAILEKPETVPSGGSRITWSWDRSNRAVKSRNVLINAQTGTTYAPVLKDNGKLITLSNASAITMTIPANASVAFPVGTEFQIMQLGAGQVTVAITSDTLRASGSKIKTAAQYSVARLIKIAATTWVLTGDTST